MKSFNGLKTFHVLKTLRMVAFRDFLHHRDIKLRSVTLYTKGPFSSRIGFFPARTALGFVMWKAYAVRWGCTGGWSQVSVRSDPGVNAIDLKKKKKNWNVMIWFDQLKTVSWTVSYSNYRVLYLKLFNETRCDYKEHSTVLQIP